MRRHPQVREAIARKAAEARGETFVPTPYDETAVDAVVVTAVPPVAAASRRSRAARVSAPAGPPLKALEAMTAKQLGAELGAAGVRRRAGVANTAIGILRDLVRRLRAGEPAASLKVPRKPKSAEELFCLDKAEQLACSEDPRPSTSIFQRTLSSSQATLVADGAKKVVFLYGRPGNGTDYLVALARPRGDGPCDSSSTSSRYAQPECGVRYPYKLGLFKGRVGGGVRYFERFASFSSDVCRRLGADSASARNFRAL
ncbi:hypothetical protein JL720_17158 [Aureococcus anophagefferens]|nr:hypothetical protein JL720_17158 [Aureococcus anophagefferens]